MRAEAAASCDTAFIAPLSPHLRSSWVTTALTVAQRSGVFPGVRSFHAAPSARGAPLD